MLQEKLDFLLKQILGEDIEFTTSENVTESGLITLEIDVEDEYKARIIGRRGRTIKAIHNLVNIEARRLEKRTRLKVSD